MECRKIDEAENILRYGIDFIYSGEIEIFWNKRMAAAGHRAERKWEAYESMVCACETLWKNKRSGC